MTTPRIEEMVEEFNIPKLIVDINTTQITDDGGNSYNEAFVWLEEKIKLKLKQAFTQAHQAGIDEAVGLLKEKRNGHCGKKDCLQAYCINRKIIREFCDDTIKALQNNR